MRRRGFIRAPAEALLVLVLGGCVSQAGRPTVPPTQRAPTHPSPESALDRALTQRVVELARSSLRAPYRRSGESRRGFDCSGLTSWVYRRAGTVLPRTTGEQAATGRWVGLDELRAGDLVFFGASRRSLSHVGIVVSEPYEPLTMIHAASSHGVVETVVVDSPYWLSRLQLGRRVPAG